jgi:hypothetical protein
MISTVLTVLWVILTACRLPASPLHADEFGLEPAPAHDRVLLTENAFDAHHRQLPA